MEKITYLLSLVSPGILPAFAQAGRTTETDFGPFANIGDYVSEVMRWVVPTLGGVAFLMIIYAGYLYMTSQGSTDQISQAKDIIIGVIVGVLLLFLVEIILNNVIGVR